MNCINCKYLTINPRLICSYCNEVIPPGFTTRIRRKYSGDTFEITGQCQWATWQKSGAKTEKPEIVE